MSDIHDVDRSDPLRPPSWRIQAAADRVGRGLALPRRRWDGLIIQTAINLERRLNAGRAIQCRHPADWFHEVLDVALKIFFDRDRSLRYALEARDLAAMPAKKIADLQGVSQLVVELYEAACFDVRDRLAHCDYITCRVINPQAEAPYEWRDSGWKLVGYIGGSDALENVLGTKRGAGTEALEAIQSRRLRMILADRMRALMEAGDELDPRLFRDLSRFVTESDADPVSDYAKNVDQFIKSIPMEFLSSADAKRLLGDDESGIELRAHEQLLLNRGFDVPGLEDLKTFRLRKPRRRLGDDEPDEPASRAPDPETTKDSGQPETMSLDFP